MATQCLNILSALEEGGPGCSSGEPLIPNQLNPTGVTAPEGEGVMPSVRSQIRHIVLQTH